MKESKPDSSILLKVQSGDFNGLFPQLQEYLRPLLNTAKSEVVLSEKEQRYRSDVALRFLHSFCSHYDTVSPELVLSSISVVVESVQCCFLVKFTPNKDPPTIAKLLVHLVSKYAKSPLFLIDDASRLVDWLIQSLLSNGVPLSSESANLADVAATYLWHGCSEMSKNSSKSQPDANNSTVFTGFCKSLKLFVVGMKNFDRISENFSIALKIWKHCLTYDQVVAVLDEVKPLLDLASTLAIQCKSQCSTLVCCMAEIAIQCASFLLRHARTREASDLVSLIKVFLKDKLPAQLIDKADSNVLLVLLECFDDLIRLMTDSNAGTKCGCQLVEEVAVKFAKQMTVKLKKFIVLAGKLHHNTFVSVLRVIDGTVDMVLGTGKPESYSDNLLEAAMQLLELRSHLCSLGNAVLRAQLLADSRSRLVDFELSEVTAQMKKLDLHCAVIQRHSSDSHKKGNCMKDLSSLEEFVNRFTAEKLLTTYEHVRLGNLAFRVGWQFYSGGFFSGAEHCMNVCVSQYRSYVASGPTEADLIKARKKLQISKTFEVLSDALKKQDRIAEAMTATVDSYLEDEQHSGVAVLSWQRIMTKLEEKQSTERVTSLTRLVKERLTGTNRDFAEINLLKEEFHTLQKSKSVVSSYHRAVVEDLLSLPTCDDLTAALALIDKAHLLNAEPSTTCNINSSHLSAVDLCKEAIKRLDTIDNKLSCVALDVKARAYTSLYILRSPDHIDKLFESATRAVTNVTRKQASLSPTSFDDDDTMNEDNLEIFTLCSQLAAEETLLEPVNMALSLWETSLASDSRIDIDDVTVDYIEVLVHIYKLMGQTALLLRAIRLLSRVASSAGDSQRRLVADTELLTLCNTVLQSNAAFDCIEQAELWIRDSGVELKCPRQYIEFLLAKAESCLLANKLDECSVVLNEARSSRVSCLKPSSRDDIVVEASIVLLEAKLRAASLAAQETDGSVIGGDLPLELAVTSTRQIGGLIQYLFSEKRAESGRHKGGDCLAEKWRMIYLLYCSIFYTGVSYVRSGDQREAKCYLLQCLRFCEAFRLRKRFSEVHLALAQLSIVSARYNDCTAHLNIISFILDPRSSKELALAPDSKQNSSSGTSSPDASESSGDFIRSRVMTLDYGTSADPSGSPKHTKRITSKSPMTWAHVVGCECAQCSDPVLESLWLSCYVVDAISRLRQGQTADAEKMVLAAYKQRKRLVTNVNRFVTKLSVKKVERSKDGKLSSAESVFQFVFCEIYLRLCELALMKNSKVDNFSSLYLRALDSIKSSFFPLSRLHLAELNYFSSMPGLVWPGSNFVMQPGSQITAIDMLCAGIGRMKASDVSTPPTKQRTIKCLANDSQTVEVIESDSNEVASRRGRKKSTAMVAAPVKKRPAGKLGVQHAGAGLELAELPRMCAPNAVDSKLLSGKFPCNEVLIPELSSAQSDSVSAMLVTSEHACDQLRSAFDLQRHNPTTILYRNICNTFAAELFAASCSSKDSAESWQISHYLSEAQSTTFRHACLLNIARKMRKLEAGDSSTHHRQALQSVREKMMFGTSLAMFKEVVRSLPSDLVVCQLSVVAPVGQTVGRLYLTRFQKDCDPITVSLPGYSTPQGQRLLIEFEGLMQENRNSMVVTDKAEWWSRRRDLDTRLHDFLVEVDRQYVGCWRGVLLGRLINDADVSKVVSAAEKLVAKFNLKNVNAALLQLFLGAVHLDTMTDQDLAAGLQHTIGCDLSKQTVIQLIVAVKQIASRLSLEASTRGPVSLILDRSLQHMPWENIPVLVDQSVVRLPSVHFLAAHHQSMADHCPSSVLNTGIRRQSVYYVVNPDNNLPNTQQTFQPWFEKEPGWKGVIGRPPTANEMIDAITKHDFFIYCGHGTGSAYLVEETLQQQSCQAAVMLMGCSSGRLIAQGELDACGTLLHYFLAGSGCIIGNMWDVTDRDIDRFQEVTLRSWLNGSGETGLLEAMREGRSACKLRWLTGAAPVMYGFPIKIAGVSDAKPASRTAGKSNSSASAAGMPEREPSATAGMSEMGKAAPAGKSEPQVAPSKRAVGKRTTKK